MNTTTPSTKTRMITLTGRRPVKIVEADWPVIAQGSGSEHDGQVECQANRAWKVWMKVRQHADGRAIVYGCAEYESHFQAERDYAERAGMLLDAGEDIAAAIGDVGHALREVAEDQSDRIGAVERMCVADLPAEIL